MQIDPDMYRSKVSVERLDQLMAWVEKDPVGKLELVLSLVQLLAVFAYIWVRNKLVEQEWESKKQAHLLDSQKQAQKEIDGEDYDGK